jgi:hypothetical protein
MNTARFANSVTLIVIGLIATSVATLSGAESAGIEGGLVDEMPAGTITETTSVSTVIARAATPKAGRKVEG